MKEYFVFMLFPPCSPDLLLFQSGPKQFKIRRLFQWRGRLRVWTLQRWQTSDKPNIVFAAIGKSGTVYQIGHEGIELRTPKFTKMRRFQEGEGEGGDEIKWRFKKRRGSSCSPKPLQLPKESKSPLFWRHNCWIQRLLFIHVTIVVRSFKGSTLRQNST